MATADGRAEHPDVQLQDRPLIRRPGTAPPPAPSPAGGDCFGSVDEALATHLPLEAFTTWFETLAAYIRVKHGLGDALHNAAVQNAIDETYAPVVGAVTRLLDACVTDGTVRPGLDPADVLLLMGYLWRVAPGEEGVAQGRRLTEIVLDGIRAGRPGDGHA